MKRVSYILSLLAMMLCFAGCSSGDDGNNGGGTEPDVPQDDAMTFAQTLGIGWNLGNSFDAHVNGKSNETCWGNGKATQATFNALRQMGFSSVRIPVTWMGHIGAAPDYKIESAWMERIAEVAGYAKKAGLKVIINIHHDGGASNQNATAVWSQGVWLRIDKAVSDSNADAEIKNEISKVWRQIAERFRAEGEWLVFETFNEIHNGFWGTTINDAEYRMLNQWNQTALDAIRSAGGSNETRYVGIPCYAANPSFAREKFVLPTDKVKDRLMVAVHSYDPYEYAGAAATAEWGHTGNQKGTAYQETYINSILMSLTTRFVSRGIPVYFGEFGCVHRSTQRAEDFRKYYLEYNIKNMREHRMPVMIWDNGAAGSGEEKFGLVNHANGEYIKNTDIDDAQAVVALMTKAWNTSSQDYTLQSIYSRAPEKQ